MKSWSHGVHRCEHVLTAGRYKGTPCNEPMHYRVFANDELAAKSCGKHLASSVNRVIEANPINAVTVRQW